MGIVDSFYELMVNTAPSEIRLYRGNEITNLVPKTDPTCDEIENSYEARKYGVSAAEMRKRKAEAKQKCGGHWADKSQNKPWFVVGLDLRTTVRKQLAAARALSERARCFFNIGTKILQSFVFF